MLPCECYEITKQMELILLTIGVVFVIRASFFFGQTLGYEEAKKVYEHYLENK